MSDGRKEKLGEEKRAGCAVLPKPKEKPFLSGSPPSRDWVGKIPNIGIFKMPPKIVVILVLRTPEHLELGLILQY